MAQFALDFPLVIFCEMRWAALWAFSVALASACRFLALSSTDDVALFGPLGVNVRW